MQPVAKRLGTLLAEAILTLPSLPGELIVVPVPLFSGKHRRRGFNQSALLARAALRVLRRRRPQMSLHFSTRILLRQRETESQAGLTPHQRRENVRGVFAVPRPAAIRDRHVLLIDDIFTTGATARACSQALLRAGAASVWVATVARAQRQESYPAPAEIPMHQDVALWDKLSTAT